MKVYIAGPMTGLPHFNRPAFQQAAINLSFEKHVTLNPAILPDGLTEADYMAIGLILLPCERLVAGSNVVGTVAAKSARKKKRSTHND